MNRKIKIIGLITMFALLLSACSDDDAGERVYRDIGSVENPDKASNFLLLTDKDTRLWVETNSYRPDDGKRIIIDFVIKEELPEGSDYDYVVNITNHYEVLTKGIFAITPETQDSIGNDPVRMSNIWIARDYLNVEFFIPAAYTKHYINLVSDASKTYDDGKVHLEFRHNANNDYSSEMKWSIASFDISTLKENVTADSVNIVIHSQEFGSSQEKTYDITYKFNQTTQAAPLIMKGEMVKFE